MYLWDQPRLDKQDPYSGKSPLSADPGRASGIRGCSERQEGIRRHPGSLGTVLVCEEPDILLEDMKVNDAEKVVVNILCSFSSARHQ